MNIKGTASLKKRFPFRLGTTSYVIPADLLSNVNFLADKVDDNEQVLFESDEITNLPDAATVKIMREMAERHDLTYTVHLPLDTWMGHEDEPVRKRSVGDQLVYNTETTTYPHSNTVTYTLGSYWTADMKVEQRLYEHWVLSLSRKNLFDARYDTQLGSFTDQTTGKTVLSGYPGAGRSSFGNLVYEF